MMLFLLFLDILWESARVFFADVCVLVEKATPLGATFVFGGLVVERCSCDGVPHCSRQIFAEMVKGWVVVGSFFLRGGFISTIDASPSHPTPIFNISQPEGTIKVKNIVYRLNMHMTMTVK